jgi:NAD(P) transhydrogenase subunit alpha
MIVGVPKESFPGERRVALIPAHIPGLIKAGLEVLIETGAGAEAGFPDSEYEAKGAQIATSRGELFAQVGILAHVRAFGANSSALAADLSRLKKDQVVIGFCDPLGAPDALQMAAQKGVTTFPMEMIPRITRAQAMDALSSMATVAGYKAVLVAAAELPRMFPMFMTAAGTVKPAHVLIIGAGVAGLQAIATARRLGAVVKAYDVRAAVKEQVESLGAKFVELDLDTGDAEDAGGYAKQLSDAQIVKQREELARVAGENNVIITTAAIPGRQSPLLLTEDAVKAMPMGSVIVDLAAERGGNCALTRLDERVVAHGVTILGPGNLPSTIPYHASQMYSKNVCNLLAHLVTDGKLEIDMADAITGGTCVSLNGEVVHPRLRSLLGLGELEKPPGSAGEQL